jgi:ParB/RepB/Spo0J family partition protein
MATKEKKSKAAVAQPAGFVDTSGRLLLVGDLVRYQHPTSLHSGGTGTLTAIHPRQDQDTPAIATVQLDKLDTWKDAPAIPALAENLTWLATPLRDSQGVVLAAGDLVRVLPDVSKRLSNKLAELLGEAGVNISGSPLCRIRPDDEPDYEATILTEFLVKVTVAEASAEHPAIQEESDLPFLNDSAPITSADIEEAASKPTATTAPVVKPPRKEASFQDIVDGTASIAAGLRLVPLASIVVTTNTRKVFDETALAELAESVRAHGILQPIVLRPYAAESGKYELVAGGRRFRAAQLAELAEVPATVRHLTDREFLEVQLLENLQRVDVRPADEAQAFAKLMKNGFALEEIAAKVGKPARFVAERARLMELAPEWVEALQQGCLLIGSAQLLARLTRTQQSEVHQQLDGYYGNKEEIGGVMRRVYSASEIRQQLDRQFKTHDLEKAAFPKDDATLYPVAGACLTCPKRTGNTPYLFDEMGGNTCLDGACFSEKLIRYVARVAEQMGADGQPVLKVADHWGRVPGDVLNLNKFKSTERFQDNEITELRAQGRVRSALMTEGARAGHIVEVVLDAAVAAQPDVVAAIKQEKAKQTQKEKDDAAKVRALGAARRQAYYQLTADVHGDGLHTALLLRRMLYKKLEYRSYGSLRELLQKVYGWEGFKGGSYLDERERKLVVGRLAAMEAPQLQGLLLDIQLLEWLEEEHPSTLPSLCKELGWSDEQLLAAHAERKKGKKQEATA